MATLPIWRIHLKALGLGAYILGVIVLLVSALFVFAMIKGSDYSIA